MTLFLGKYCFILSVEKQGFKSIIARLLFTLSVSICSKCDKRRFTASRCSLDERYYERDNVRGRWIIFHLTLCAVREGYALGEGGRHHPSNRHPLSSPTIRISTQELHPPLCVYWLSSNRRASLRTLFALRYRLPDVSVKFGLSVFQFRPLFSRLTFFVKRCYPKRKQPPLVAASTTNLCLLCRTSDKRPYYTQISIRLFLRNSNLSFFSWRALNEAEQRWIIDDCLVTVVHKWYTILFSAHSFYPYDERRIMRKSSCSYVDFVILKKRRSRIRSDVASIHLSMSRLRVCRKTQKIICGIGYLGVRAIPRGVQISWKHPWHCFFLPLDSKSPFVVFRKFPRNVEARGRNRVYFVARGTCPTARV